MVDSTLETTKENLLSLSDIVGNFEVLDFVSILPPTKEVGFFKSLVEAKKKIMTLSSTMLNNTSILTYGFVKNRPYIFFYSSEDDIFDHKRVFNNGIEQITLFNYLSVNFVCFFARELPSLYKVSSNVKNMLFEQASEDMLPRIAVIFEAENIVSDMDDVTSNIFSIFKKVDTIIYVGKNIRMLEKKKGSMILC